jgi:hypothetical protein
MNQPGNWSGAILGFIAVSLAVVTMALLWEAFQEWRRRRAVADQIKHLSEGTLGSSGSREISLALLRGEDGDDPQWLKAVVAILPQRRDIAHLLEQADMSWSVGTYLLVTFGIAAATSVSGGRGGWGSSRSTSRRPSTCSAVRSVPATP